MPMRPKAIVSLMLCIWLEGVNKGRVRYTITVKVESLKAKIRHESEIWCVIDKETNLVRVFLKKFIISRSEERQRVEAKTGES